MAKVNKGRQQIDGNRVDIKIKSRNPVIEFDTLQIYMDIPHIIDIEGLKGKLTIYSPTLGQVIKMGQTKFYMGINPFITNTTQYRLPLWEMGVDWNDLSDFDLFCMLLHSGVDKDVTDVIFGEEIDWSKFALYARVKEDGTEERILYNEESDIEINELMYFHISQYIRKMILRSPDEKITKDSTLKNMYIMQDKRHRANEQDKKEKGEDTSFSIQSLISACVNHPGFKYKKSELMEIGLNEFYDSVRRLQIYESSIASMHGAMGGMIDAKKLPKDVTNFMREISE